MIPTDQSGVIFPAFPFWRRDLIDSKLAMWNNLASRLANIVLSQDRDEFKWRLDQTGIFLVKSHYLGLIYQNTLNNNKKNLEIESPTQD